MNLDNLGQQYKAQTVNTMTQNEILILLFDELIKRLRRSKICLENDLADKFEQDMTRAREIVSYLIKILNMNYEISHELYDMYIYFNQQIAYALTGKDIAYIDDLLPMVIEIRDTWVEAAKLSRK